MDVDSKDIQDRSHLSFLRLMLLAEHRTTRLVIDRVTKLVPDEVADFDG